MDNSNIKNEDMKSENNESANNKRRRVIITVSVAVFSILFAAAVIYFIMKPKEMPQNITAKVTAAPGEFITEAPHVTDLTPAPLATSAATAEAPTPSVPTTDLIQNSAPAQQPVLPDNIVLSALDYGDGRVLKYNYSENMITASDEKGNMVLALQFDSENRLLKRTEYSSPVDSGDTNFKVWEFDEKGRVTSFRRFGTGAASVIKYLYDNNGKIEKTVTEYGMSDISTYEYNYDGSIDTQTAVLPDGSRVEYIYKDGRVSEEKSYGNKIYRSVLNRRAAYEYYPSGALFSAYYTDYKPDGTGEAGNRYIEYDKSGNIIYIRTSQDKNKSYSSYAYNDKNRVVVKENEIKTDRYTVWSADFSENNINAEYNIYSYDKNKEYIPYKYENINGTYYLTYGASNYVLSINIGTKYEDSYDASGRLVLREYSDKYGSVLLRRSYEYDESGLISRDFAWNYEEGSENILYDIKYEYSDDRKYTEAVTVSIFGYDEIFRYDKSGILTVYERKSQNEEYTVNFTYNTSGRLSGRYITFSDGSTARFEYDADEARSGQSYTLNTESGSVYCNFDSKGHIVREIQYSGDGGGTVISSADIQYTENDAILSKIVYTGDNSAVINRIEYIYNDSGSRVAVVSYDSEGKEIFRYRVKYESGPFENEQPGADTHIQGQTDYDMNGNLVSLTTYDSLGNIITGVFSEETENIFRIYQKCSIADLIPESW